jgi:hypothetical protein
MRLLLCDGNGYHMIGDESSAKSDTTRSSVFSGWSIGAIVLVIMSMAITGVPFLTNRSL